MFDVKSAAAHNMARVARRSTFNYYSLKKSPQERRLWGRWSRKEFRRWWPDLRGNPAGAIYPSKPNPRNRRDGWAEWHAEESIFP
jgi:hypothetical protein